MAALRAGLISFSCSKCKSAPYIKDTLGCDKPMETAATWLGEEDEFYNCPIKFITENTGQFFEKYDSYKNGIATPPDYEKQSAKFFIALRTFEYYLDKFITMLQNG